MVSIEFIGWFQARFATDPDPYDHPRGKDGWTFALPGEPDFDRVIRFADPVALRSHAPQISVSVTRVLNGGQPFDGHPLVGGAVTLLDGAKFEGHNGDVAGDGSEPVFPLHLRIAQGALSFEVLEWLTFADLKKPAGILRHGKGATNDIDSATLGRLLGGLTPAQFRAARRMQLVNDLAAAATQGERDALQARIGGITTMPADGIKTGIIPYRVRYSTKVPAASRRFADPASVWALSDPLQSNWVCRWWMGAWDADALCGYVEGALDLG